MCANLSESKTRALPLLEMASWTRHGTVSSCKREVSLHCRREFDVWDESESALCVGSGRRHCYTKVLGMHDCGRLSHERSSQVERREGRDGREAE